jgi:hypothetical protein
VEKPESHSGKSKEKELGNIFITLSITLNKTYKTIKYGVTAKIKVAHPSPIFSP